VDRVALLPSNERSELFRETSAQLGMSPAIVEKDFWVCWVLKNIFSSEQLSPHLVFKGGTSLSKVYGLIERFSEDVDLILDWRLLGYGEEEDPYQDQPSRNQQDHFNQEFNIRAANYIAETLCPQLEKQFNRCQEVRAIVDTQERQTVNVQYPAAFSLDYLLPEVRLEIGPLASYVPHDSFTIRPYAAEAFPDVFDNPDCSIVAIKVERTFWEKATILHQQAHRTGQMPSRYSRHYYDMYKLAMSVFKDDALADLSLLEDVVRFKERFYPCVWARYGEAKPGAFRLIPKVEHLPPLRRDYNDMAEMIFGEIPDFDQILETLGQLENEINGLSCDDK
jgi:predicted nucleotidyltransferase component of viral defense system